MYVQFDDVFPGNGARSIHRDRETPVEHRAVGSDDLAVGGHPIGECGAATKDARGNRARAGSTAADDRDRAAPRRGRDRRDRLVHYFGETTSRRSGSTPSDSVRTTDDSDSAKCTIFRSLGSIGSSLIA